MGEIPVELVVAAFQEEDGADETLKVLKEAKKEKLIGILQAAVIRRDEKDKVHVKDVRDVGGGKGAAFGALVGAGVALLTGGVGIILSGAIGALVGGAAARKIDMGLPNKTLKEIADSLKPGNSAIIAVIEHRWVAELEDAFEEAGASVIKEVLKADIAEQLAAGKDVAYSALASEGGVAVERVAGDDKEVEVGSLVLTEDGVTAQASLATEDGIITRGLTLTEDGLVFGEVGATSEGILGEVAAITDEGEAYAQFAALPDEDETEEESK